MSNENKAGQKAARKLDRSQGISDITKIIRARLIEMQSAPDGSFLLDLAPVEDAPWKVSDNAWFEANPDRSFRLRQAVWGERPGSRKDYPTHVVERQVWVRLREKRFLNAVGPTENLKRLPDSDTVAKLFWDCSSEGATVEDFMRLGKQLESLAKGGTK